MANKPSGPADRTLVIGLEALATAALDALGESLPGDDDHVNIELVENGAILRVWLAGMVAPEGRAPASPATLPLLEVDQEGFLREEPGSTVEITIQPVGECPDPIHELLTRAPEPAEALYQVLRTRISPPEHTPTLQQLRAWTQEQRDAVARWVAVERLYESVQAGQKPPERLEMPGWLTVAMDERDAELRRLRNPDETLAKPSKKKRGGKP